MNTKKSGLKARDVMVAEPVCVEPWTTIRELARVLQENEISGVPVTDGEGRVIGVVSKTDLIRRCSEGTAEQPPGFVFEAIMDQADDGEALLPEPLIVVQDFMTEDPVTASPDTPVSRIARQMFTSRIHRVIVVDKDRFPLGIITSLDLIGYFPKERPTRRRRRPARRM